MTRYQFFPEDIKVEAQENETIYQASLRTPDPLTYACGGKGRCSTCRVRIMKGLENCTPRTESEQAIAKQMVFESDIRLACQTKATGFVEVRRLVSEDENSDLRSLYIKDSISGLAGIEKHVFILFADIRGFTSFAESLLPYDVIHLLNRYFYIMGKVIAEHGGYIDNYMGDGLMALFEADEPKEGAVRAVTAGLGMLEAVKKLVQPYSQQLWGNSFEIGIGLHYGLVVAGTVGDSHNKRSTVIGDAVNFASRIESANKKAGTHFLISEDAYSLVSERITGDKTIRLELAGKTGQYTLHEVTGLV